MKKTTHNERETKKTAQSFAKSLKGGELVLLFGDLGSGKTTFTKGIAKELGIKQPITSPTFSLMNIYNVKNRDYNTLVHIDCYRLSDFWDLKEIGACEYFFDPLVVTVVEWAERIEKTHFLLGKKGIRIYFYHKKEKNERIIEITY